MLISHIVMNINDNLNIQFIITEYYYAKCIYLSMKYYVRLEIYIHITSLIVLHFSFISSFVD